MKQFYTLLTLLFTVAVGALAQSASISFDESKAYKVEAVRGHYKAYQGDYLAAENTTTADAVDKFAFLQSPTKANVYYLYSIGKSKFVSITQTATGKANSNAQKLVDTPDGGFKVYDTGNSNYSYYMRTESAGNSNFVNINGVNNVLIDGWGPGGSEADGRLDEGNCLKFTEVTCDEWIDLAVQAAKNKIAKFENQANTTTYYKIVCPANITNNALSGVRSVAGTNGVASSTMPLVVRRPAATTGGDFVSQLWQLESVSGGAANVFKFINVNAELPLSGDASTVQDTNGRYGMKLTNTSSAGSFIVVKTSVGGQYKVKTSQYTWLNAYGGDYSENFVVDGIADLQLGYWDDGTEDANSKWKFAPVTVVPVSINTTAEYASVGFPFAVQVPQGVTAYYATDAEPGRMQLAEIEGGIIPAKTGAVIYKQGGGQVDLTITANPATQIDDNKLTATTARREGFTSGTTYVLALNNANKAAFLKSTLQAVPANKAYLDATNVTTTGGAEALEFLTPTGIADLLTPADTETEYYDLQGRRVLFPANGIFVTKSGRKLLIK